MSRRRTIATIVFCLIGLGLAAFLTYGHYFDQAVIDNNCLRVGAAKSTAICCGCVTTSAESIIFGLPVALYGLVYFVVMLALCLPVAWRSTSKLVAQGRLALSCIGVAFVIYLIAVELLEVHHICLFCTGVHITQFVLFLLIVTGWYDTGYAYSVFDDVEPDESARAGVRTGGLADA